MHIAKELLDLGNTGQVGLECPAATFSGSLFGIRLGAAVMDGYPRALLGQAQGNRSADAAGRPRYENNFSIQSVQGCCVTRMSHRDEPIPLPNISGAVTAEFAWIPRFGCPLVANGGSESVSGL